MKNKSVKTVFIILVLLASLQGVWARNRSDPILNINDTSASLMPFENTKKTFLTLSGFGSMGGGHDGDYGGGGGSNGTELSLQP